MLKSCGKKLAISVAGATFTCLVVLLVAAQHQRIQVAETPTGREVGMRSLQSLDSMGANTGARPDQGPPRSQAQDNSQPANKRGFSAYFSKLTRDRREVDRPASQAESATEAAPAEDIDPSDIFIAVKTTKKFHQSRLNLLLDTWISRNMQQTYIFTDGDDEDLKKKIGSHAINTNCSAAHSRQALSCKMAVEYDKFIESGKKWFCHVDDDNYVNVHTLVKLLSHYPHTQDIYIGKPSLDRPIEATERLGDNKMRPVNFWFATGGAGFCVSRGLALKMSPWASGGHFMNTAEKIRLPDDCTIGYIIESVLGVHLIRSNLFHSHLENLQQVPKSELHKQVTLSYGMFENKRNIINMKGLLQWRRTRQGSSLCTVYCTQTPPGAPLTLPINGDSLLGGILVPRPASVSERPVGPVWYGAAMAAAFRSQSARDPASFYLGCCAARISIYRHFLPPLVPTLPPLAQRDGGPRHSAEMRCQR